MEASVMFVGCLAYLYNTGSVRCQGYGKVVK